MFKPVLTEKRIREGNMVWIWIVVIYLAIGVFKAISHLSSGKVGSKGVLATIISVTLFWPILLFSQK